MALRRIRFRSIVRVGCYNSWQQCVVQKRIFYRWEQCFILSKIKIIHYFVLISALRRIISILLGFFSADFSELVLEFLTFISACYSRNWIIFSIQLWILLNRKFLSMCVGLLRLHAVICNQTKLNKRMVKLGSIWELLKVNKINF